MHRTEGDGYITDPVGGQNVFADENPPTRNATQLRHEEANAWQEEICNVIIAEGFALNIGAETVQQMIQLNTAIDKKDTDVVASILAVINLLDSDDITNNSFVSGFTVTDALEDLSDQIDALGIIIAGLNSSDIDNVSSVSGGDVTDALDTLLGQINSLQASDIANNSNVVGSTVQSALNTLNTDQSELPVITRGSFTVAWGGNISHANQSIQWRKEYYANDGKSKVILFLPDIDQLTGSGSAISDVYYNIVADELPSAIRPPDTSNTFMPLFFGHGDAGTHRKQMSGGLHLQTNNATNKKRIHFCMLEGVTAYFWDHGLADNQYLTLDRAKTEYWLSD